MSTPAPSKVRMNVDEFLAWAAGQPGGRYELVDGEVVGMSPERALHNLVKLEVAVALREGVKRAGVACTVFTDGISVVIDDRNTREPDAAVQCGSEVDLNALSLTSPMIMVEVLSPSTEQVDTETKLVEYFSVASIRHYLIVAPKKRAVIHHQRNPAGNLDTRIAYDGEITFTPPGIAVPVAALLGPAAPESGAS